jgi:hypothetical protein
MSANYMIKQIADIERLQRGLRRQIALRERTAAADLAVVIEHIEVVLVPVAGAVAIEAVCVDRSKPGVACLRHAQP